MDVLLTDYLLDTLRWIVGKNANLMFQVILELCSSLAKHAENTRVMNINKVFLFFDIDFKSPEIQQIIIFQWNFFSVEYF